MLAYLEKRKQEVNQALAAAWLRRGQAAKEVEDADAEIQKIAHRLDEIERATQAEKSRLEEEKKKAAEKQACQDKDKPEIVPPCASGEATGAIQGDDAPAKE